MITLDLLHKSHPQGVTSGRGERGERGGVLVLFGSTRVLWSHDDSMFRFVERWNLRHKNSGII